MSSPRIQTIEESIKRLRAVGMSGRFATETNEILGAGITLLESCEDKDHEAILVGTAILALSGEQYNTRYPKKKAAEKVFSRQFGTNGFYPISYPELVVTLNLEPYLDQLVPEHRKIRSTDGKVTTEATGHMKEITVFNPKSILIVGKAALAGKIPFDRENFAGCGFFNIGTRQTQENTLYKTLYQKQENDRFWRKIGRAFLVGLSAFPLIFPAYFTYKWMKRKNELDEMAKDDTDCRHNNDEIKLVKLSRENYQAYVENKEIRRQFKKEKGFDKYKVSDKPKKYVSIDKTGQVNIYMDSRQKSRFDFFSQKAPQFNETYTELELGRNLPATSCTTLRRR